MKNTVCAVVVTYNRSRLLIECLEALLRQTRPLDGIYIIDNASTDGTPELLKKKGFVKELPPKELKEPWEKEFVFSNHYSPLANHQLLIYYVRMHENTGGAGGFHEGVKRAYEKGYDWLWLMDDDGKPKEDCLENLLLERKKYNIFVIQPLVVQNLTPKISAFRLKINQTWQFVNVVKVPDFIENYLCLFNGVLIHSKIIDKIGFPKKELFIWGDEVEYFLRLKKSGLDFGITKKAIFYHPQARLSKKGKGLFSIMYSGNKFRDFIYYRNRVFIYKKYKKILLPFFMLKNFTGFVFFVKQPKYIFVLLKAFYKGLREDWTITTKKL